MSLKGNIFYLFLRYFIKPYVSPLNTKSSIKKQREVIQKFAPNASPPPHVVIKPITVCGIAAELIGTTPKIEGPIILYLHGGGYALGSPRSHHEMVTNIALASNCKALLIDYRLAPEHPFPAALEDAITVYCYLLEQGISPQNIAIAGDSAGGGLSLATLLSLRNNGTPLPAAVVCLSPWTDLTGSSESFKTLESVDPILQTNWLNKVANFYAGDNNLKNPLISPLYADLQGLPPLLIQVGSREVLLNDSTDLAKRAQEAGVDVTLDVWDNMWHVWHTMARFVPEAQQAINKIGKFIQQHLNTA